MQDRSRRIILMRTTMNIHDDILAQAKAAAAAQRCTVSDIINRALRDALTPKVSDRAHPPLSLPVYDSGQRMALTPQMLAALRDEGR